MADQKTEDVLLRRAVEIVKSYVSHNPISVDDLPKLIHDTHNALRLENVTAVEPDRQRPAVPVKKSVTPEYIVCLEDGKKLKMLKRHLKTAYDMTPDEYRSRWGLPADYPMVAPNYAQRRSQLAKKIGLGTGARGKRGG